MPCLDVALTGGPCEFRRYRVPQTLAVPAILFSIYSLNKYFEFLSDKLPFTLTLTGMSEFNRFSRRGLQKSVKFYFRFDKTWIP